MAYTGWEYKIPEFLLMNLMRMGNSPALTKAEYGTASTTSTSWTTLKTFTCGAGSDMGILVAYRINPDAGSSDGYLRVLRGATPIAAMTTAGAPTGTNHLVGIAWDTNHPDCVDICTSENGESLNLQGYRSTTGTLYVEYSYFELSL